jgi:NADH-quinone oxidoreductase subunit M
MLGGVAVKAPALTVFLVIIALANIALPLTNAFAGEFLMFTGLYRFNGWMAAAAGISIILSAAYTLNMIRKVFFGDSNERTAAITDISFNEKIALGVIVCLIFALGIYPQPFIELTKNAVTNLVALVKAG